MSSRELALEWSFMLVCHCDDLLWFVLLKPDTACAPATLSCKVKGGARRLRCPRLQLLPDDECFPFCPIFGPLCPNSTGTAVAMAAKFFKK